MAVLEASEGESGMQKGCKGSFSNADSDASTADCDVSATEYDVAGEEEALPTEIAEAAAAIGDSPRDEEQTTVLAEDEMEQRCAELRCMLHQRSLIGEGLPPYRTARGAEIATLESPLLSDTSLRRYLSQSRGDVCAAAASIQATLAWRRTVFPDEASAASAAGCRAAQLLAEDRRFRRLGVNRDGDIVVAFDFCWGHLVEENDSTLDVLRMALLGAEMAFEEADACGRPAIVLVVFGGPPPCNFAQVALSCFEKHYPERLKRAVVYPLPAVWTSILNACLKFIKPETRSKIFAASTEDEAVEHARLTSGEQLPEDWRGGITRVRALHRPNVALMNGIVLEYLNPLRDDGKELEASLADPWDEPEGPGDGARGQGFLGWLLGSEE